MNNDYDCAIGIFDHIIYLIKDFFGYNNQEYRIVRMTSRFQVINPFNYLPAWQSIADVIKVFSYLNIFWLVNLIFWAGIELSLSLVSFFNWKNNLKTINLTRSCLLYYTKLRLLWSYKKSLSYFFVSNWL